MKFLICLSLAVLAGAAENKPPNVLFIVADDLGRELSRAIMFLPPATRVERRVQYPHRPGVNYFILIYLTLDFIREYFGYFEVS